MITDNRRAREECGDRVKERNKQREKNEGRQTGRIRVMDRL